MGNLLALAAALFFGTGDFAGGMASRKASPWQVLFAGNALSVIILTIAAGFLGEPAPAGRGLLFPFLAGSAGAIGLVSLYRGLAMGRAALVSPLSGVIAAGLPVLVAAARDGLPGFWQLAGFALAIPGIWLVSQTADRDSRAHARGALLMGVLAGISFGLFYVLIAMVPHDALFGPMAIIKLAGAAIAAFVLLWGKVPFPRVRGNWVILLPGILDPSANVLYALATRLTRLDIAAMLSSLYPMVTVICAAMFLRERVRSSQWLGIVLCVLAIILITL